LPFHLANIQFSNEQIVWWDVCIMVFISHYNVRWCTFMTQFGSQCTKILFYFIRAVFYRSMKTTHHRNSQLKQLMIILKNRLVLIFTILVIRIKYTSYVCTKFCYWCSDSQVTLYNSVRNLSHFTHIIDIQKLVIRSQSG
jgi:hypothetical protein